MVAAICYARVNRERKSVAAPVKRLIEVCDGVVSEERLRERFVVDERDRHITLWDGRSAPNDVQPQSETRPVSADRPQLDNVYGSFDDIDDAPSRQLSDDWVSMFRTQPQ
jgi:hypothetical protein